MNQGPNDNLVRRWLPHGSFFDLYLIYCANQVSASEPVASSSTFYRALENSGWRKLLRFLPPSSHSKCTICSRLKSKIKHATDIEKHLQACDQLMRHLAGQFQDRACYYEFRHRAKTTGDILCLIVDSMDRGKFALPRYVGGRVPKDIADVKRPSAEVTTVLAHGHGVFTYLADENQTAGSNWTLECLNRTLEHIFVRAQKLGKAVPPILKLFSDNTPKEVKNGQFGAWASSVVGCGYWRVLSHEYAKLPTAAGRAAFAVMVMADFFSLREVAERLPVPSPPTLSSCPNTTKKNVYLHPWHLDMSNAAKYGINGKWPSNVAIRTHLPSIIKNTYQSEREALEIKFPPEHHGKTIPLFSVQFVDGHAKSVMVHAIFALLDYCARPLLFHITENIGNKNVP
ncbi:Uncharacterized protein SCF082_LOCUS6127 [Durusdinium trenchii]|uniref:DUF7869 domain-containing protein n=1 Tax=Durusdinium trenchii TaxID=1381693 RepID=A0ABP0IDL2_9DINO